MYVRHRGTALLQNVIAVFVFSDSRRKNACKMLADLCPCFHQSPTRPNFSRSRVKVCPILCRLSTKLCPNFGCSRARLCPISFAPCPFPNLAGTLLTMCLQSSLYKKLKFYYAPTLIYSNYIALPVHYVMYVLRR